MCSRNDVRSPDVHWVAILRARARGLVRAGRTTIGDRTMKALVKARRRAGPVARRRAGAGDRHQRRADPRRRRPASAAPTCTSTSGTPGRRRRSRCRWWSGTSSSARSSRSARTSTTSIPARSSAAKATSSAAAAATAWPAGGISARTRTGVGVQPARRLRRVSGAADDQRLAPRPDDRPRRRRRSSIRSATPSTRRSPFPCWARTC